MRTIDYQKHIGERHGKLTIIERVYSEKRQLYLCKCDCGKYTKSYYSDLVRKDKPTKSCGCSRLKNNTVVNGKRARIYEIYIAMKRRTYDPKFKQYEDYGGRGLVVCDEWLKKDGFSKFKTWAMQNGYRDDLTIDRIDVNGNYEPKNCRWITRKEQNNNRRNTKHVTYNGSTKTLSEWADIIKINNKVLYNRIFAKGWNVERAFSTPVKKRGVM